MSPTKSDFEVTLSTLRFGKCAKKIENKIKQRVIHSYDREAIRKIVEEYEQRCYEYEQRIKALEEKKVDFMDFWKKYGEV